MYFYPFTKIIHPTFCMMTHSRRGNSQRGRAEILVCREHCSPQTSIAHLCLYFSQGNKELSHSTSHGALHLDSHQSIKLPSGRCYIGTTKVMSTSLRQAKPYEHGIMVTIPTLVVRASIGAIGDGKRAIRRSLPKEGSKEYLCTTPFVAKSSIRGNKSI